MYTLLPSAGVLPVYSRLIHQQTEFHLSYLPIHPSAFGMNWHFAFFAFVSQLDLVWCSGPRMVPLQAGRDGHLEKFEMPAKIKLTTEPWLPESGLVTASFKVKREAIKKAYAQDLKALYA